MMISTTVRSFIPRKFWAWPYGERLRDKIFWRSAHTPWNFNQLKKSRQNSYICRRIEQFQLNLILLFWLSVKTQTLKTDSIFLSHSLCFELDTETCTYESVFYKNLIWWKQVLSAVSALLEMQVTYKKGRFSLFFLNIYSLTPFYWNFLKPCQHPLKFH